MKPKTIDDTVLEKYESMVQVRYKSLFSMLQHKVAAAKNHPQKSGLSDLVEKYGKMFSSVLHAVSDSMTSEPISELTSSKDDFLILYSAYIASRTIVKDAESASENEPVNTALLLGRKNVPPKDIVEKGKTEYTAIRKALESMVDYLTSLKEFNHDDIADFFIEFSNQANKEIKNVMQGKAYEKLKDISWKIGLYDIDGLKDIVQPQNGRKIKSVQKSEKSQFNTPLVYLHIDKAKVLPKERIVGDPRVLTQLERMVKCLFLYNPKVGRNPTKEKRIFRNKILLQGLPGGGKGAVSFYAIDYAERFNQTVDGDLMVTEFDIDSSYEDGKIQKLKSQIGQIVGQRRLFLIYEDEIDGILKADAPGHQKKSDLQVIKEFNKFLDGEYPDNGNYLFLANLNDIGNLSPDNRRRFYEINWQGAVTKDQKTVLFRYKLEDGMKIGYVSIDDESFGKLGQLAFEHTLTGADITQICDNVTESSFRWDLLPEVYKLKEDYEKQLECIDKIHDMVTLRVVEEEFWRFIDNKTKSNHDSLEYRGVQL